MTDFGQVMAVEFVDVCVDTANHYRFIIMAVSYVIHFN